MRGAVLLVLLGGCADTSQYTPQAAARGELVLRVHHGFEMYAGGKQVARSPGYAGLTDFVRCVPQAQAEARTAVRTRRKALALQSTGGIITTLSFGGIVGIAIEDQRPLWIVGGVLSGLGFGLLAAGGWLMPRVHGHAIGGLNYYNDAVGSLGATCEDPQPDLPEAAPGPKTGAAEAP